MKKIIVLLCLVFFGLSISACGAKKIPGTKTPGVLVVGMECDYPPFNWMESTKSDTNVAISNVDGAYAEGYDVQIAKKIAEGLNLELKIKSFIWDGLIPALKSGEIDLIIAGMSPTEDRKRSISFTDGYYRSTHVLLVRADSEYATATTMEDFDGAKVAGQLNTLYARLVPQLVAKGAIAGADKDSVPLLASDVKRKVLDATIVEEPVAQGLVAADSSFTYVKLTDGFVVADEDVLVAIGTRKECNFIEDINNILASISTEERNSIMARAVEMNA